MTRLAGTIRESTSPRQSAPPIAPAPMIPIRLLPRQLAENAGSGWGVRLRPRGFTGFGAPERTRLGDLIAGAPSRGDAAVAPDDAFSRSPGKELSTSDVAVLPGAECRFATIRTGSCVWMRCVIGVLRSGPHRLLPGRREEQTCIPFLLPFQRIRQAHNIRHSGSR